MLTSKPRISRNRGILRCIPHNDLIVNNPGKVFPHSLDIVHNPSSIPPCFPGNSTSICYSHYNTLRQWHKLRNNNILDIDSRHNFHTASILHNARSCHHNNRCMSDSGAPTSSYCPLIRRHNRRNRCNDNHHFGILHNVYTVPNRPLPCQKTSQPRIPTSSGQRSTGTPIVSSWVY